MEGIRAVDTQSLPRLDFQHLRSCGGIQPSQLPTVELDRGALQPDGVGIVSWRWDLGQSGDRSLNLAAAICAAQQARQRYLLFDLVSVAQDQSNNKLIEDIANLGELFSRLPVFAAYDEEGVLDWLATMRRPWLFSEARAFHSNDHKITYASHQRQQGGESSFGFRHMLNRVWTTNYTSTVLLLLAGRTGIGELGDLAYIIPHHRDLLASTCRDLARNDFLLTAAILCQAFYDDGRFHVGNNDASLDLVGMPFNRYALSRTTGPDHAYDYYDVLLDGKKVATYYNRMKPDRFTLEPDYVRYLIADGNDAETIYRVLHRPSLERYQTERDRMKSSFSLEPRREDVHVETVRFYS